MLTGVGEWRTDVESSNAAHSHAKLVKKYSWLSNGNSGVSRTFRVPQGPGLIIHCVWAITTSGTKCKKKALS